MCGIETRLYDISEEFVERGMSRIRGNLEKGVEKGKVSAEDRDAALARLSGTTDLNQASSGVQAVIEAVPEKIELKRELFAKLSAGLGP